LTFNSDKIISRLYHAYGANADTQLQLVSNATTSKYKQTAKTHLLDLTFVERC